MLFLGLGFGYQLIPVQAAGELHQDKQGQDGQYGDGKPGDALQEKRG